MGAVLKFPKRKTALELNQDELERATVERSKDYRALAEARQRWIASDNAVHELQMERQRLLRGDK